jgi:hypothetical protein
MGNAFKRVTLGLLLPRTGTFTRADVDIFTFARRGVGSDWP